MIKTIFKIDQMDCSCQESLIRMKLQEFESIRKLDFDLAKRTLSVFHAEEEHKIAQCIDTLELNAHITDRLEVNDIENEISAEDQEQRKSLWIVLGINLAFFFIEVSTGFLSGSMGLVADSLDMLADTIVYGLSLFVVGASIIKKKKVAQISGYLQVLLALSGLTEVVKRFFGTADVPQSQTMIIVSIFALLANATCIYILQKVKKKEAHIQASVIFSSNDIIINAGVISAGLLVWVFNSKAPDLIIGGMVFLIVIQGAIRILKLSK